MVQKFSMPSTTTKVSVSVIDLAIALRRVIQALEKAGDQHIIVGSMTAGAWGALRNPMERLHRNCLYSSSRFGTYETMGYTSPT